MASHRGGGAAGGRSGLPLRSAGSQRLRSVLQPPVVAALAAAVASVLPVFLIGAMAVQLRADFDISVSQIGAAALWYFVAAAIGSLRAGRMVEAIGARLGLMLAGAVTAVAMIGVALGARVWVVVLAFMALAGAANAIAQPAANLMLARVLPPQQRGLGFGVKQSAIPAATLLGGLFVPVFALTVGWRWGFVCGAVLALAAVLLVHRCGVEGEGERDAGVRLRSDVARGPLLVMGMAAGLGSAAALAVGTFYVDSAVATGISPTIAGLLFAGGSVVGIVARIGLGLLADLRPSRHLLRVTAMFVAAGVGFLLLAVGRPVAMVLGTVLAFGAGLGWQGLFVHSLVRQSPNTPAVTTGFVQIMVSAGSALGPPGLGAVVDRSSYAVGWVVVAAVAFVAALTLAVGRRMALASRAAPPARGVTGAHADHCEQSIPEHLTETEHRP